MLQLIIGKRFVDGSVKKMLAPHILKLLPLLYFSYCVYLSCIIIEV